jgi:hypothetical protein
VPESEDGAVRPMRFLRWRMFAHDGCSERAGCRINTIGLPASTYPLHSACADSAVEQTGFEPSVPQARHLLKKHTCLLRVAVSAPLSVTLPEFVD